MYQLEVESISHRYGARATLDGVSFRVGAGDIGCLLGPSGGGKTTALLCVAGLESVTDGEIKIRGQRVAAAGFSIAPEKRRVGMVFQEFALFPHLTVAANVAFGLARGRQAKTRVDEMLSLCDLRALADARPHELSGGEQQRTAIARALAPHPDLLLLDEPFSSLDDDLRERLARQVRDILKSQKTTALMVTHNQHEAFAMADAGGVLNRGELCQWGEIYNLYHRPQCAFVANFIGDGALVGGVLGADGAVEVSLGRVAGDGGAGLGPLARAGDSLQVLLRPDDIVMRAESERRAIVVEKRFRGANTRYTLRLANGERVYSSWPSRDDLALGAEIGVGIEVRHLVCFPSI